MVATKRVLVAELTTPHGVRGLMRLRSFVADPADIFTFKNLENEDGKPVKVHQRNANKDLFIVAVDGVDDRNAADGARGTKLYVDRAALGSANEDEFFITDLEGLSVRNTDGAEIGSVTRLLDYGAGPVLDIKRPNKAALLLPFTDDFVPTVDITGGFIVIIEPVEI